MGRTESYLLVVIGVAAGVTMSALAVVQPTAWAGWHYLLWGGVITIMLSLVALPVIAFSDRRKTVSQNDPSKKVGDISVTMGNSNSVGHIGHKIYEPPPPSPTSIIQDDRVVGDADGPFHLGEGKIGFHALHASGSFQQGKPFIYANLVLEYESAQITGSQSSFGRLEKQVFQGVTCKVVGQLQRG